ncbi:MAG: O-methyltransferase [Clostridiaceae bacterium]|nr:O-methyltransferase [Clostridiaceae bacterium]
MKEYAESRHIPIVVPETARFIEMICAIAKPRRVLEIGTAIGFSSIIIAKALDSECIIDTVEVDADMASTAAFYIRKAGLDKVIRIINGEALDVLQCLDKPYDLIFLDAAKGQYPQFLPHCLRLINVNGILLSDNVLYGGLVAKHGTVEHKHRTIANRLREYLEELFSADNLITTVVPIGDGIAVSYRKV